MQFLLFLNFAKSCRNLLLKRNSVRLNSFDRLWKNQLVSCNVFDLCKVHFTSSFYCSANTVKVYPKSGGKAKPSNSTQQISQHSPASEPRIAVRGLQYNPDHPCATVVFLNSLPLFHSCTIVKFPLIPYELVARHFCLLIQLGIASINISAPCSRPKFASSFRYLLLTYWNSCSSLFEESEPAALELADHTQKSCQVGQLHFKFQEFEVFLQFLQLKICKHHIYPPSLRNLQQEKNTLHPVFGSSRCSPVAPPARSWSEAITPQAPIASPEIASQPSWLVIYHL